MKDYLGYTYRDKPFTQYPDRLAGYIIRRYEIKRNQMLLDVGCGRREYTWGFRRRGILASAIDRSDSDTFSRVPFIEYDLMKEPWPYDDNSFDVVFCKSVLEHFYYPELLVKEIYRILKPGGLFIAMTPDWETSYKYFYGDYTHRMPFTLNSLHEIMEINGFGCVEVEKFLQLPVLWEHPWLKPFVDILAGITPMWFTKKSKFIRFAKAIMLLGSGRK